MSSDRLTKLNPNKEIIEPADSETETKQLLHQPTNMNKKTNNNNNDKNDTDNNKNNDLNYYDDQYQQYEKQKQPQNQQKSNYDLSPTNRGRHTKQSSNDNISSLGVEYLIRQQQHYNHNNHLNKSSASSYSSGSNLERKNKTTKIILPFIFTKSAKLEDDSFQGLLKRKRIHAVWDLLEESQVDTVDYRDKSKTKSKNKNKNRMTTTSNTDGGNAMDIQEVRDNLELKDEENRQNCIVDENLNGSIENGDHSQISLDADKYANENRLSVDSLKINIDTHGNNQLTDVIKEELDKGFNDRNNYDDGNALQTEVESFHSDKNDDNDRISPPQFDSFINNEQDIIDKKSSENINNHVDISQIHINTENENIDNNEEEDEDNGDPNINVVHETSYNEETAINDDDVMETTKTNKECTVTDKKQIQELEDGTKLLNERTETVKKITVNKTIEGDLPDDYVPDYPTEQFSSTFPFTTSPTDGNITGDNEKIELKTTENNDTETVPVDNTIEIVDVEQTNSPGKDSLKKKSKKNKDSPKKIGGKKGNIFTNLIRRISKKDKKPTTANVVEHKDSMAEFEFPNEFETIEMNQVQSEQIKNCEPPYKEEKIKYIPESVTDTATYVDASKNTQNDNHDDNNHHYHDNGSKSEKKIVTATDQVLTPKKRKKRDLSFLKLSKNKSPHKTQVIAISHQPEETINDLKKAIDNYMVVVAIDFGTAYAGYAFSYVKDPNTIHMMREVGDPGMINHKCPTALLMQPDGTFHSFGFHARDYYHNLDPNEATKWLYFDKFKMALYNEKDLNINTEIEATNGEKIKAIIVFSHALRFFKEHVIKELTESALTSIAEKDIRWVITVPAIWKAESKQFMRRAAYMAGIADEGDNDSLLIALEPEAASIYCRKLKIHQLMPEKPPRFSLTPTKKNATFKTNLGLQDDGDLIITQAEEDGLPVLQQSDNVGTLVNVAGTRYMVIDCGGGTLDLTVHEMDGKYHTLKELYKAVGGPFGSISVDMQFHHLLDDIFTEDFLKYYKKKRPSGYVDLMINFESRKRAASPFKDNPLNIPLPFSFIALYRSYAHNIKEKVELPVTVDAAIYKYNNPEITIVEGMMRVSATFMRTLFDPTLENISTVVQSVLDAPQLKNIEYLFLVGGFAESVVLQHHLRENLKHNARLIIPQEVGLTILKGAVCFGLDPCVVSVRISRQTYGVGVLNKFVNKKHPVSKLVEKDGVNYCVDVFDKFVTIGESVCLGDSIIRRYKPAISKQSECLLNLYCADRSDIEFVSDDGVRNCGKLKLILDDWLVEGSGDDGKIGIGAVREIQARMIFGDTEIKASAIDVQTGKCVKAVIDFLNK